MDSDDTVMEDGVNEAGGGRVDGEEDVFDINATIDQDTRKPILFHNLFDTADASLMAAAEAARNTMVVHVELADTIPTPPGVKRCCRLHLPRTATVVRAKRDLCRLLGNTVYPSFMRLSLPDGGETLADTEQLQKYDVRDGSFLELAIAEGDIFESLRREVQPRGIPLVQQMRREQPAAAAAGSPAAEGADAPAAGGGPTAGPRPSRAPVPVTAAPAGQAAAGVGAAAAGQQNQLRLQSPVPVPPLRSPPSQGGARRGALSRDYKAWDRQSTIAVLRGMLKHGTSWRQIQSDPAFKDLLGGRNVVNLKDRWVTLRKAAERGFQSTKGGLDKDHEIIELVGSVLDATQGA